MVALVIACLRRSGVLDVIVSFLGFLVIDK